MDAWAARSHARAVAAIDDGRFESQIVPVELKGTTEPAACSRSTSTRGDSTPEKLASLPPLHPEIPEFSITAGNSSGLNDGAAALVMVDRAVCDSEGLTPLATVRSWASIAVDRPRPGSPRRPRSNVP